MVGPRVFQKQNGRQVGKIWLDDGADGAGFVETSSTAGLSQCGLAEFLSPARCCRARCVLVIHADGVCGDYMVVHI